MSSFKVYRSPLRQFLFGLAGLVLILAAIDIVWAYQLSEPPTTNDDGALTTRGYIDRRGDVMWGTLFLLVGGGTEVVSIVGLLRRRPVLEILDTGIAIRIASGREPMLIPWHRITSVRSGTEDSPDAAITPRQLLIEVDDVSRFPEQLWGAEWQGDLLRVDTNSWAETAVEVVVRINLHKARLDATRPIVERRSANEEPPATGGFAATEWLE